MTPKYEPDNIFAKILRGEMPCVKVYEDDVSLAFMDVMPRAEGHTLVIPKAPARTLLDLAPDDLARFMPAVQKVGRAVDGRHGGRGASRSSSSTSRRADSRSSTCISISCRAGRASRSARRADRSRAPRRSSLTRTRSSPRWRAAEHWRRRLPAALVSSPRSPRARPISARQCAIGSDLIDSASACAGSAPGRFDGVVSDIRRHFAPAHRLAVYRI